MSMKTHSMKFGYVVVLLFSLSSCTEIIGNIVFPNRCIRCEVKNWSNSFWSSHECGGGRDVLETECKAVAYDLRHTYPEVECQCNYYTQPKTE